MFEVDCSQKIQSSILTVPFFEFFNYMLPSLIQKSDISFFVFKENAVGCISFFGSDHGLHYFVSFSKFKGVYLIF